MRMMGETITRMAAAALLCWMSVGLTACDGAANVSKPTTQYVVEINEAILAESLGDGANLRTELLAASEDVIVQRLEGFDITAHEITITDDAQMILNLSGPESMDRNVNAAIGLQGEMSFRMVDEMALPQNTFNRVANPGSEVLNFRDVTGWIAVKRLGGIPGSHIEQATPGLDPRTNEWVVNIMLDERGGQLLGRITSENIGKQMAAVLDGEVLMVPIIQEPILGGQLQLSGYFTEQDANELAIVLRSGALPAPLVLTEVRTLD